MATKQISKSKQALARDYQQLLKDTENLLGAMQGELDDKTTQAKERLEDTLEEFKGAFEAVEDKVKEKIQRTDEFVHDYPYHASGAALGFGFLIGLMMAKRH